MAEFDGDMLSLDGYEDRNIYRELTELASDPNELLEDLELRLFLES